MPFDLDLFIFRQKNKSYLSLQINNYQPQWSNINSASFGKGKNSQVNCKTNLTLNCIKKTNFGLIPNVFIKGSRFIKYSNKWEGSYMNRKSTYNTI